MTPEVLVCEWCARWFDRPSPMGPPPRFCSNAHRQRAYEQSKVDRLLDALMEANRALTPLSSTGARKARGIIRDALGMP